MLISDEFSSTFTVFIVLLLIVGAPAPLTEGRGLVDRNEGGLEDRFDGGSVPVLGTVPPEAGRARPFTT